MKQIKAKIKHFILKKNIPYRFYTLLLVIPVLFFSFIVRTGPPTSLTIAKTEAGTVSGVRNSTDDVTAFKGIPFAAPPVGDLRWKAPEPAKHWDGIRKCDSFGPSPMQAKPVPMMVYTSEFLIPEKPISEDCLYLNVWTNARKKTDKKPVLIWIYGGGFGSGGSACPIYDGEALAKKGIVFVSINYRVGPFGFLALPDLSKESNGKGSGNYGLLDQISSLKWVKQNIAAFGGDPENVTIAGQSAGSMSINCLVASPLAKGLFNKAIAESGSLLIQNPYFNISNLARAEERGRNSAEKAGLHSLLDLRKMSAEEIMKQFTGLYSPVVDGYVLPEPLIDIYAKNKQNHVFLITGWNADEGFAAGIKKKDEYKKQIEEKYRKEAAVFLKYFPGETDEQAASSQIEISRDEIFALSGYKWATIQSGYDNSLVYVYNFNRKVPATGEFVKYGAFHTAEVPYVLNNLRFLNNRPLGATDSTLAAMMSDYWVNFIKSGSPNGTGLPEWPRYTRTDNLIIVFDSNAQKEKIPNKDGLDFLISNR